MIGKSRTRFILMAYNDAAALEASSVDLRKEGYQVYATNDGIEALDCIDCVVPDLAIVTIDLLRISGDELAIKIRAQYPNLPIIMIASDKPPSDGINPDRLLISPVGRTFLLEQIRELLSPEEKETGSNHEIVGPEEPFNLPSGVDAT